MIRCPYCKRRHETRKLGPVSVALCRPTMTKADAARLADAMMRKASVPLAYPVQNPDGTWRVETVA